MLDLANDLFAYEAGELSEAEEHKLFSALVANGMAWTLQGFYGRTAVSLIEAGVLDDDGEILIELED